MMARLWHWIWVLGFWVAVLTVVAWIAHNPTSSADTIGNLILKLVDLVKGFVTAAIDLISKVGNGIAKAIG